MNDDIFGFKSRNFTFLGYLDKFVERKYNIRHTEGFPGMLDYIVIANKLPEILKGKLVRVRFQLYKTELHNVR